MTEEASDYDNNIPLAKQLCGGTDDDNQYLESMIRKTAVSAKENMDETWFDGDYNSNKNIALARHCQVYVCSADRRYFLES